jgi:UDP-N-acetylmuramoyl-tripeptide--D-alanyl-D-alanine ligase
MIYYFYINFLIINIYLYFRMNKAFHMLQQNWYNDSNRYVKWAFKNLHQVINKKELIVLILLFISNNIFFHFLVGAYHLTLTYDLVKNAKRDQVKKPLVNTPRIKRLKLTTYSLLLLTVYLGSLYSLNIMYAALFLFSILIFKMVYLANIVNKPIEKLVYLYYKTKAQTKLKNINHLEVIGITGSYGKTSCKNILNDILNVKYNSFATPKSFNTPYGLIITINNNLDKFTDYFIAEMGAFYRGEIKGMCKLVRPRYGILTIIGKAHLDTFGSSDNIMHGKFELIENIDKEGTAILNADDPRQIEYVASHLKNTCDIKWISINNDSADYQAKNIKISSNGTTFDVYFSKTNQTHSFTTKLLGKENVYNILAGIALGHLFGMNIEELQRGVSKVNSIPHRLELKKYKNINIIDDAYNSNPVGAKMALDVLNLMDGKKIVVTPGMIELGDEQQELNKVFGKQIAKVADAIILIGEKQTKDIKEGIEEEKYNKENIYILNDVKQAFPLIEKLSDGKTYVLLENDLPDLFNE